MRVTGDTGESVLEFTVFAAFHSYKRTTDRWVAVHENEIRQRYKDWINDLGDLSDIKVDVQAIRVSLDQQGTITCGIDYDEIDISTKHHIVGAIVVMSRALVSPSQGLGGDSI